MLDLKTQPDFQNVSRETLAMLQQYINTLFEWNKSYNLVSKNFNDNIGLFVDTQIVPCLNLYNVLQNTIAPNQKIIDLGSGAGLPGLVLGILGLKNILNIDRIQKKIAFQQHVIRKLNLGDNVTAVCQDIADFNYNQPCIIVSKAVATCQAIIKTTTHLLCPKSKVLLMKSDNQLGELADISEEVFDTNIYPNILVKGDNLIEIKLKT